MVSESRAYGGTYRGEQLNRVAFPLGGIGAGMICLEGNGALSHVSVRNKPAIFNEPPMFSALRIVGDRSVARVLEGPVPPWKVFFPWGETEWGAGNGGAGKSYGLPRCARAAFRARFPFGVVELGHPGFTVDTEITGWSPFIPGDSDNSSLPVAALEYRFTNPTGKPVEGIYSFHAYNLMSTWDWTPGAPNDGRVLSADQGFVLWQPGSDEKPWDQGAFSATVDDPDVRVNCAWFRGGWFDPLTMVWKSIQDGTMPEACPISEGEPSLGGSLYVPFRLGPGEEKVISLRLAWYVPETGIRFSKDLEDQAFCCGVEASNDLPRHRPWYAGVFSDIEAVTDYWREHYAVLRERSLAFSDCFYDSSLPPEVIEAVAANLAILKSPTVLRQTDGRLWCYEGCCDSVGCCAGSTNHVWDYAQAIPHLFPALERSLRATEFGENQDERGHQCVWASLPIRPAVHDFHAAADGQLGGIMRVHREWRISGDTEWLRGLWPKVKQSLQYCISTWDPDHKGIVEEPHFNTYDIEFWGPDGMCTSIYLGALKAAIAMAEGLGDETSLFRELLSNGRESMESELWDGEYFIQRIEWHDLKAGDPTQLLSQQTTYSHEAQELLTKEGPKYQYGAGCLSDGVLGAWIARVCGVGDFLDQEKVRGHLLAVHKHNLRHDLSDHANPQRPTFALGKEGGLLLCSWPKGGELSLPFIYSNEVWTGIEYQVASHLMMLGEIEKGLEIVRTARDRYDGRVRNPFNEYECGSWYARALSSYGLLQGLTGVRYDAVEKTLYLKPSIQGDFRSFFCTASGYGTVGVRDGEPFVEVVQGSIPYERIVYPAKG